jgi:Cytochrome c554 and c-prime
MRFFTDTRICLALWCGLLAATFSSAAATNARPGYVGDQACQACHKAQSENYSHTAHHLTSQIASRDSILGSFAPGDDQLLTANPQLHFRMEARDDGFFQTAIAGSPGMSFRDMQFRTERLDVVIGSGRRAQTYLYWRNDQLFELPVSDWVEGHRGWVNSPGYDNGFANFERTIAPRCVECHASFIHATAPGMFDNHYERDSLIPGVTCESCHGPGQNHIAQENASAHHHPKPGSQNAAVLNPAHFSRDRQIDLCALCHNGIERPQVGPAFSYMPGQVLADYLQPNPMDEKAQPDVHGNQVGLLRRSKCYLASPKMTCTTCHDVHAPEREAASYSSSCLKCHQVTACGMYKTMGTRITTNCIDCHMPLVETGAIVASQDNERIRTKIRTHWIKVYPEP